MILTLPKNSIRAESDAKAQAAVKTLLEELGEDPSREGLVKTPAR